MYSAIWRRLPGPTPVKAIIALIIIAAIVLLLFQVVFPWLQDVTGLMETTVPTE
ncbi:MAG: hypothetical protein Q4E03_01805 [Trueperella sp.]|nr:hypothetical protein [Trueperella sp.]